MNRNEDCLLIDDVGNEHPWPSSELAARFGCAAPDFDFPTYAVRSLGYVIVTDRCGLLRIRMRPLLISNRTLAALFYCLAERMPRKAALSWFVDEWRHELCGDSTDIFQRITEILDASARRAVPEPFLATHRSMEAILDPPGHPFYPLLRLWLDRKSPDDLIYVLKAHGLWERTMIAERDRERGYFIFRHSGGAIQLYGASWGETARGRRLQDQPDPVYGAWIAEGCQTVDDGRIARYELVHAAVNGTNQKNRRWRYERLMLPWQMPDGTHLVVSVTARDYGPGRWKPDRVGPVA